jgi:hypothetical protein
MYSIHRDGIVLTWHMLSISDINYSIKVWFNADKNVTESRRLLPVRQHAIPVWQSKVMFPYYSKKSPADMKFYNIFYKWSIKYVQHNSTRISILINNFMSIYYNGKAVPLQAWTGPQGSRRLRPPDLLTSAQEGGRLSALRTGRLYTQD